MIDGFGELVLSEQLILLLAALVLMSSFLLLLEQRLVAVIHAFAWQGALVSVTTALVAFADYENHLYISAAIIFLLKAILIPGMLLRQVRRLGLARYVGVRKPAAVLLVGTSLVVFSYYIAVPIENIPELGDTRNTLAIALAVVLLGLLTMVVRHNAVGQVVGFMAMANGLFFAAVSTSHGMPLIIELGIAFDVLVAAVLFGVFFFQIRGSLGSFDVDLMNRLSEREKDK